MGDALPKLEEQLSFYSAFTTEQHNSLKGVNPKDFGLYHTVVVALNQPKEKTEKLFEFLTQINKLTQVVLVNFGDYKEIKPYISFGSILQAHNNLSVTQELSAQLLFGGIPAISHVNDEVLAELNIKERYYTEAVRLGYTVPEYAGISSDSLAKINEIIQEGIANLRCPDVKFWLAKEGQVIFS